MQHTSGAVGYNHFIFNEHVLYCTVLYCTVLYCTVLYCTVLYCTVLYCTAQPRTPQGCCKLLTLPACYNLSTNCNKLVNLIKSQQVC